MIELLSGWLRQIVILVLIATFMDLLLPNNAMERYVKLVMGLLIILAILSPVFQWIRQDLDLTALAFDTAGMEESRPTSLSTIRKESKQLEKTQDRLVREEAERRLESAVQKEVEKRFDVKVVQTRVKTGEGEKESGIAKVFLTVLPVEQKGKDEIPAVQPVDEVQPVIIDGSGEEEKKKQQKNGPSPAQREWEGKITRYLTKTLGVGGGQVKVEVLEGDQGR